MAKCLLCGLHVDTVVPQEWTYPAAVVDNERFKLVIVDSFFGQRPRRIACIGACCFEKWEQRAEEQVAGRLGE